MFHRHEWKAIKVTPLYRQREGNEFGWNTPLVEKPRDGAINYPVTLVTQKCTDCGRLGEHELKGHLTLKELK